jgi:hypothetical protein
VEAEKWQASLVRQGEDVVTVSALKGWGIDKLKAMIKTKGYDGAIHA